MSFIFDQVFLGFLREIADAILTFFLAIFGLGA